MSARTMWKVTVAVMKVETREVCAVSAAEAKEMVEDDPNDSATVLDVRWIDAEAECHT